MATEMDQGLADSIAMLEQILEVMPQDFDATKALFGAYLQGGDTARAYEFLSRLVEIAADTKDSESIAFVMQQLGRMEAFKPSEVAAHRARLRTLESDSSKSAPISSTQKTVGKRSETDISEELALAWRLYEENQLTQDEYSSVLHDLTDVSSKELDVPVSVLHVLEDRGYTQMSRIMNYLTTRSGVPFVQVGRYEMTDSLASALPLSYPVHLGALPFAFFDQDLLVGVLNPFNNALVDQIENETGRRCHTYLVGPEEYDKMLGKLKELAA